MFQLKKDVILFIINIMLIKNLCAGYSNKTVISNFSLVLNPGEKILICGPNGCGKTTLLKCILNIVKPLSGQIIFENGETVAYCKQDFPNTPFPITVEEVVSMGLKKRKDNKEKIYESLQKAGASDLKNRLFYSLSGGEKQKVSLARCYCQNADILLLDEPSAFLDIKSKRFFIDQMKILSDAPFSIIAVTHDTDLIQELGWKIIDGNNFLKGESYESPA